MYPKTCLKLKVVFYFVLSRLFGKITHSYTQGRIQEISQIIIFRFFYCLFFNFREDVRPKNRKLNVGIIVEILL